jgi:hypothetical protein
LRAGGLYNRLECTDACTGAGAGAYQLAASYKSTKVCSSVRPHALVELKAAYMSSYSVRAQCALCLV